MKYLNISNCSPERSRVTYAFTWWDHWGEVGFTEDDCDKIVDQLSKQEKKVAEVSTGVNLNIRVSEIQFFKYNNETSWIFEKFNTAIQVMNARWYGFDLNGYEMIQYTEYPASKKGHYGWHTDIFYGDKLPPDMIEPRKLSFSLCLNDDYKGGEFQFNLGNQESPQVAIQKKGRILCFPSFVAHQVTPITFGSRKSLVIWVTGPKFR